MTRNLRNACLALTASLVAACGTNSSTSSAVVGPAGATLRTASGVTLRVEPGAVATETQIEISDVAPRHGEQRRIEIQPHGLRLVGKATVTVQVDDSKGAVKLVEVEAQHGAEGEIEVEHALETEHGVEVETEHARKAEIEHLGTLEVRDAVACDPACAAGFECDDGVCKVHDEVETHVEDPAQPTDPAAGGTATTCPAGMELDATDGTCKAHGGSSGSGKG